MKRHAWVCTTLVMALPAVAHAGGSPADPGPYATVREQYGFGDTAFFPQGFGGAPVEMRAVLHRPEDLDDGPFPLVIMLHGRHSTCFDPSIPTDFDPFANASGEWPCAGNHLPIPSLDGYDYWAANLASHGYIVVSIGANGINAVDSEAEDRGASARAQLIAEHLALWQAFNDTDEYGTTFNGRVDLDNIGLVGHSRGGEGVATYFGYAAANGLSFGVRAALLLAPTDYNRHVVTDVPLAVMLPYCDGDVFDLQGVQYYDDARHASVGDDAPKYVFEMPGSNHNFYNTVWSPGTFADGGAVDDFGSLAQQIGQDDATCGADSALRLDEGEQQASYIAFANAFFRTHLGGETEHQDMLRGDVDPPPTAAGARITYMPPDAEQTRLVVHRVVDDGSLLTNDLDGTITASGIAVQEICGVNGSGGTQNFRHCVDDPGFFMGQLFEGRQPHVAGLAQHRLAFGSGATWTHELPGGVDVASHVALQLRAVSDFTEQAGGGPVTFDVALVDGTGLRAQAGPRVWSDPIAAPQGGLYPIVPKLLLQGVRIPIAAFVANEPAIDLENIVAVELAFTGNGALLVSDLLFADEAPPVSDTSSTGDDSATSGDDDTDDDTDPSSASADDNTGHVDTGDDDGDDDDDTDDTASGGTVTSEGQSSSGGDGCGCTTRADGERTTPLLLVVAATAVGRRRRRAARPRTH